jgi:hypothetical protein
VTELFGKSEEIVDPIRPPCNIRTRASMLPLLGFRSAAKR